MSMSGYVEKDGKRIDITGLPTHWEARCDGCGEYLTGKTAVTGTIEVSEGPVNVGNERWDAHPEHRLGAIDAVVRKLIDKVTPL